MQRKLIEEITEVVKVLEYTLSNSKIKVGVKIKKTEEAIYYVTSHIYKPIGGADYYRPGAGASSVEDAVRKASNYIDEFTNDYKPNDLY